MAEVPARGRIDPTFQIGHRSVFVEERLIRARDGDLGSSHHLAALVDAPGNALPTAKGAQIGHRAVVVKESAVQMIGVVRIAHHLAAIVDSPGDAGGPAKCAQIGHRAAVIEIRMGGIEEIERKSHDLTGAIDIPRPALGITGKYP